ncbi:IST1 homolog isoform X2 [Ranitomeya variabilis]|uniref:IST1 homolog isoform X2 n=1 Tax=Ranitomeya variabilis TaxID=490064 RepID=UPI004055B2FB
MFSSSFKPDHLRSNLKLAITRLKMLVNKRNELVQKTRKEIADYLEAGKRGNAQIRVEHIVRVDYTIEVLEILYLYCQLLLERLELIKTMKEMSPDLEEAVSGVVWCAPRLEADIPELKPVSIQLCNKYGKKFGKLCQKGKAESINRKLIHGLSTTAPSKCLVEKYLMEISDHYNIPYEADVTDLSEVQLPDLNHLQVTGDKTWKAELYGGERRDSSEARYVPSPHYPLGVYEPEHCKTFPPTFKVGVESEYHPDMTLGTGYHYAESPGCFKTEFSDKKVPPAVPVCPPSCDLVSSPHDVGLYETNKFYTLPPPCKVGAAPSVPDYSSLPHGYAYASVKRNSTPGKWYHKFTK